MSDHDCNGMPHAGHTLAQYVGEMSNGGTAMFRLILVI
ncbi:hypothetical protein SAMN05192544_11257 [Paraburkholderia hospita]|jgi:hypothetical protein|nr:hypothetical protein SAMN05192544_11257 [Paraburkholderia hospita]SKD03991.1 hypothetical protein SAMN05445504_9085 [Burkholderia sp. CF099]SKD06636.1 hypothetical protein SAMN05446934_10047 [Paraburkholderia hospita]